MYDPMLFRDRERPAQIALGGVVPAIAGGLARVLIGASSGAYWAYSAVIALATVVGGFEHQDGWGGADRGLVAGAIYGIALLLMHALVGVVAGLRPGGGLSAVLAVITAIAGMLLSALGGRTARVMRERRAAPAARGDTDLE